MRKTGWFLLGLLVFGAAKAQADNEWTIRDKSVVVRSTISISASLSTSTILIDLSDTTNWPHKDTGSISISAISIDFDKPAASTCTIKIGVVNFVNTSTGSVTWFFGRSFTKNVSNTGIFTIVNMDNAVWRCKVKPNATLNQDGTTPYILSSDKTSGSTTFNTATALPSPGGQVAPGQGDIVMQVINSDGTNAIPLSVQIVYHSDPL